MPKITKNDLALKLAKLGPSHGAIPYKLKKQVSAKTWKVAGILEHRQGARNREFLVVWDDSSLDVEFEPSWEPESNISQELLTTYYFRIKYKDIPICSSEVVDTWEIPVKLRENARRRLVFD